MEIFVVQCITGNEDTVRKKALLEFPELDIIIPRRRLKNKKGGKSVYKEYILFPGYIFIKLEGPQPDKAVVSAFRGINEAIRFLPENGNILPLPNQDAEIITRLTKTGEIISDSVVSFDKNNRIVVHTGPMEGLEGMIIKVDRRKERARVRLDMYEKTFEIDFPFSDITKAQSAENKG